MILVVCTNIGDLFKFSEQANAVFVHDVLEAFLNKLFCFLAGFGLTLALLLNLHRLKAERRRK
jgi:preprotein translocase subunit SecG